MNPNKNTKLTDISKELRRNMTPEEKHLWYDFLKALPQTVQRQKVIGNYVADFYIAAAHAIIELDGAQHYNKENLDADRVRDEFMYAHGIDVWRYTIGTSIHDFVKYVKIYRRELPAPPKESLPLGGKVVRQHRMRGSHSSEWRLYSTERGCTDGRLRVLPLISQLR